MWRTTPKEPTVHEKSTPLVLPETTEGSLADVPRRWASAEPGRVAFSVRSGAGWTDVTVGHLRRRRRRARQGPDRRRHRRRRPRSPS